MFNRGKRKADEEDDLTPLRSGIQDDDDESASFLNGLAPQDDEGDSRRKRGNRRGRVRRSDAQTERVGLIGGFFRVIGIALVSLLIFLLIGFGIAFGANSIGAFQMVDLSSVAIPIPTIQLPEIALLNTPEPTATETPLPPTPMPSNTPFGFVAPTLTPDILCLEMGRWWDNHMPIYNWFAALSVDEPPTSVAATLQQMITRRNAIATAEVVECIVPARDGFVTGYDQMISAFQLVDSGDVNAARSLTLSAAQAFADGFVELWNAEVNTADSPLTAGVPAGSGLTCGASNWYDVARAQRSTFFNAYRMVDVDAMSGSTIRQQQNVMFAALDNVRALSAPDCAAAPARYLVAFMDDLNFALQYRLGSNRLEFDRLRSAWHNQIQLDAWLQFMGIAP
ncbi:MAG: hypothetical protein IAE80_05165 [Anaerolinea sp.]|nr:hypothetical protein [Anaerolinea sp.]